MAARARRSWSLALTGALIAGPLCSLWVSRYAGQHRRGYPQNIG